MRNILLTVALVAAIALAPMVAVANTPDGPAPAPDFRALAFEGGMDADAEVSQSLPTRAETASRMLVCGLGAAGIYLLRSQLRQP